MRTFEDGQVEHREYLYMEDKDPRVEFTETLIEALGDGGTIFTYTGYETGILKSLALSIPSLEPKLSSLTSRETFAQLVVKP